MRYYVVTNWNGTLFEHIVTADDMPDAISVCPGDFVNSHCLGVSEPDIETQEPVTAYDPYKSESEGA